MTRAPVLQFRIQMPVDEAECAVREALQERGFGILTEVDVAATLRTKLGIETPPHRLLGACNPRLAHTALEAEPSAGAFLPCGIALREGPSKGETIAALQNPGMLAETFASPGLAAPAEEALALLRAALESVGEPLERP